MSPPRTLEQIPLARGTPVIGHTLAWLRNPVQTPLSVHRAHGDVFRYPIFFQRPVVFAHPDAVARILTDPDQVLSTAQGWQPFFGRMMKGGLLLRDHEDHRHHRGLMRAAFSATALRGYAEVMTPRIAARIDAWVAQERVVLLPEVQALLLELAGVTLLGVEAQDDLDRLTRAFEAIARGVMALVGVPLPGTALARGLRARAELKDFLQQRIAARRAQPGPDLFSRLCAATDEQGAVLSDEEIIDHIVFVWMAAHDTTTGAMVMAVCELARHPDWQERVRDEALALPERFDTEAMREATSRDHVISETLRLYPPVGSIPRRTVREAHIGDVTLPPNTPLRAAVLLMHRHPEFWTDPDRFDPERFAEPRSEHRTHRQLYRPFGTGAHACLGMQMARIQLHAMLHHLLRRARVRLPHDYTLRLSPAPSLRPADGLPVHLEPIL